MDVSLRYVSTALHATESTRLQGHRGSFPLVVEFGRACHCPNPTKTYMIRLQTVYGRINIYAEMF